MQTIETELPGFWAQIGIRSGCEKISLGGVVPGEHYTIIWKQADRKIDLHITYDDPQKAKDKIFEITFFAANRVLVHLKKMEALYKTFFAGRITTMEKVAEKHKNWLLHPLTGFGDEISKWLKTSDRELRVRKSMKHHVKATFLHPYEASFYDGCHWQVYDANIRWLGYLFQKEKTGSAPQFIYVSQYRHDLFKREVQALMVHVFSEVQYFSKYKLV